MSSSVKLGLYVVLTIGALLFGYLFGTNYRRLEAPDRSESSVDVPALAGKGAAEKDTRFTRVVAHGIFFFIFAAGLGILAGHDVSQMIGNRAIKTLYNDEGAGLKDPEYDRAEQEWADGHYLEAIRLMRDYLQKNPREVHAAIRIAEIYEKDLHNHLAAALEYEEILKQNLPPERWGWSAIHLCNLYFKLSQPDKALTLLRRIESEYGETQAAEKARKRLEMFETEGGQPPETGDQSGDGDVAGGRSA